VISLAAYFTVRKSSDGDIIINDKQNFSYNYNSEYYLFKDSNFTDIYLYLSNTSLVVNNADLGNKLVNYIKEQTGLELKSYLEENQLNNHSQNILILNYDEDKDSIILATEEDYALYLQQLKEKIVDSINIEIKDDSEIEPLECFGSALDYQDQINKSNNHIKNDSINIINNKVEENHINSSININDNIINNNDINNSIQNKDEINDYDIKVEDIVFYYKCTSCSIYPIIYSLYYCPQCSLYV
jgi:hypothetical protein